MLGLEWPNDPTSYTGGSIATGSVSLAGQFKGDDLDSKGYPKSSRVGIECGANNLCHKTNQMLKKLKKR